MSSILTPATMNIAIIGFGREGKSILRFLRRFSFYRKASIEILDRNQGKHYLTHLERFDIVFRSPGVPYNLREFVLARKRGVEFSSATKLFFSYFKGTVIGITGTKGKGTTSTLIYKILKDAGRNAHLAGNIGTSPLAILPKLSRQKNPIVVLELSSFQLQDLTRSPHIAVVLDIFPDHQDSHLNLREYYEAKTNIARHQGKSDHIFYFKNHSLSVWAAKKSRGKKHPVQENGWRLFSPHDLKIPGSHNFKNAIMAATVALHLKIPKSSILKTVKGFRGLEHRLEFVKSVGGVRFYNDSGSTNPHTTAAAAMAFKNEPHALIAGGQDKNLDYTPLAQALKKSRTKLIILFGENKRKIEKAIHRSGVKIEKAKDLKQAVRKAWNATNSNGSTVIVFSPGAASFDMFKNYADRGEQFKKLVKQLKAR